MSISRYFQVRNSFPPLDNYSHCPHLYTRAARAAQKGSFSLCFSFCCSFSFSFSLSFPLSSSVSFSFSFSFSVLFRYCSFLAVYSSGLSHSIIAPSEGTAAWYSLRTCHLKYTQALHPYPACQWIIIRVINQWTGTKVASPVPKKGWGVRGRKLACADYKEPLGDDMGATMHE